MVQITGDNVNHGTQIAAQTNYNLEQTISAEEFKERLSDADAFSLKDMPLLDIDDGVLLALYPENMENLIRDTAERVATFIPHTGRTFGVKNDREIKGITPSTIQKNDILIVEPCIAPRDYDLVLLCLNYSGIKRGVIARLFVDLHGNRSVRYDDSPAIPMPVDSLICGVVIEIKRRLVDNIIVKARLNPNWDMLSTLVKE